MPSTPLPNMRAALPKALKETTTDKHSKYCKYWLYREEEEAQDARRPPEPYNEGCSRCGDLDVCCEACCGCVREIEEMIDFDMDHLFHLLLEYSQKEEDDVESSRAELENMYREAVKDAENRKKSQYLPRDPKLRRFKCFVYLLDRKGWLKMQEIRYLRRQLCMSPKPKTWLERDDEQNFRKPNPRSSLVEYVEKELQQAEKQQLLSVVNGKKEATVGKKKMRRKKPTTIGWMFQLLETPTS